jgi:hypothetical protein
MKRYMQFAAGVLLVAIPIAATVTFAAELWLHTSTEFARYRNLDVTINVSLEDTVALAIAGTICGVGLIRRLKDDQSHPRQIPWDCQQL